MFALTFGIVTTGVAPNAPATETDEFELVALALELAAEDGFDEPQPARTRQASKGITVIARRRRMKTSVVVDVSAFGRWPEPPSKRRRWETQQPAAARRPEGPAQIRRTPSSEQSTDSLLARQSARVRR